MWVLHPSLGNRLHVVGVQDASKAQRSEEGDMDTSPAAIAKRVAVVVSVLLFTGAVLFLLALKFAFPELI